MKARRGALPTLTEVIDVQSDKRPPLAGPASLPAESLPLEGPERAQADADAALRAQFLNKLRPRIDALLEARLQAALAPQLARLADELAQRLRTELATELRALVTQAVDEALTRRRKP